ncbi:hypothetical protein [Streptomyces sp. NPDC001340]
MAAQPQRDGDQAAPGDRHGPRRPAAGSSGRIYYKRAHTPY